MYGFNKEEHDRQLQEDKDRARMHTLVKEYEELHRVVDPYVCRDKFDITDHPLLMSVCISTTVLIGFSLIDKLF